MHMIGKLLIAFGAALLLFGLLFEAIDQSPLPLGHLPGDIYYQGKNTTFYFPVVTCLLLSLAISVALYLVNHFRH